MKHSRQLVFDKGARVVLSEEGVKELGFRKSILKNWPRSVVGFSKDGSCYYVRADGQKSKEAFHGEYLKPATVNQRPATSA